MKHGCLSLSGGNLWQHKENQMKIFRKIKKIMRDSIREFFYGEFDPITINCNRCIKEDKRSKECRDCRKKMRDYWYKI